ncbi:unnamed protein product [Coregonus sp. 'balchen']|nr:unnamed protein product [Coregonus sp. 'balchen']
MLLTNNGDVMCVPLQNGDVMCVPLQNGDVIMVILCVPLQNGDIIMVTDVQLAIFANMLGVSLFLLVVLYHYVAVNNPKKLE